MYKIGDNVNGYNIIRNIKNIGNKKYLVKCLSCNTEQQKFYNSFKGCRFYNVLKRNIIDKGDYLELELTGGEYTKIDKGDYEIIKNNSWYKSKRNSVESRIKNKLIKLHRLIMGNPIGKIIDHINGDTLDNRKSNLRICTIAENTRNKFASKSSKTGIKGVWYDNIVKKYAVQITLNGERYWGGYFIDLEDAKNKVNTLTKNLHGDYAKKQ